MSDRLHSVIVDLTGDELAYQYMCREGTATPPLATFRKSVRLQEIEQLVRDIAQILTTVGAQARQPGGVEQLRERGGRLYDRIIPEELAEKFRSDTTSAYLVLYLDPMLAWLPWELIWDGESFLCQRFQVARLLQKTGNELRAAEQRLREERSGRGALVILGDVSGLKAEVEKASVEKLLSKIYGSNIWFYSRKGAADALEQLKSDYELCHFIGHGQYNEKDLGDSGWKFADGTVLTCRDIEAVSSRAIFPLLIYANSCDSARPMFSECQDYVSTLYRAFLRQGVPHYIGTIARIPDEPAGEFARLFYERLVAGQSVGEALAETRRIFAQRPGIPIWAYYIHYGDPTYRLVPKDLTVASFADRSRPLVWGDLVGGEPAPKVEETFVDRDRELAEASKHLQLLKDGRPGVVFVAGEAGVGKTAFVRQLLRAAERAFPCVGAAVGTCNVQLGLTDPYTPFKGILHSLVRNVTPLAKPLGEAMTVGEAVVTELLHSFPQLISVFRPDADLGSQRWERICQRLGLSAEKEPPRTIATDQMIIFDQFVRLLRKVSAGVPLILVVDNLHCADDSSLALFFHLGHSLSDARVLLLATYRPDLLMRGRGESADTLRHAVNELRRHGARTISLDLSTAKPADRERIHLFVTAYLDYVLPGHRLPAWFAERLATRTGGNALFLRELVDYSQEKGHIVLRDGKWELGTEAEQLELPESVGVIIDERIEQLSEELRETLAYASVEGQDFTAQVLASLQQLDEDKVLNRLVEDLNHMHQLVDERGEHELSPDKVLSLFHFRNTLTQQHVYQELGAAQRRRLHKRVGECLEALYGDKRMELAGQLAIHFRIAREPEKALTYTIEAARAASRDYASREALRYYKMALELWELTPTRDPALKATLLQDLADIYKFTAMFDEAIDTYQQILSMDPSCTGSTMRAYAINGIGDIHRSRGDCALALPCYQECERIATEIQDANLLVEVWTDLADLYYRLWMAALGKSRKDEARSARQDAECYANRVRSRAPEIGAWENLRRVTLTLGSLMLVELRFIEAEELYITAAKLAEQHNLEMSALNNLGEVCRKMGRYDEALKHYHRCLDWAVKTGASRYELMLYGNIGLVHFVTQDFERARDFLDKSLELNKPLRYRGVAVLALATKGITFEIQGASQAALELYREALRVGESSQSETDVTDAYGKLGRLLFGYNELQPAAYLLRKCLENRPPDAGDIQQMLEQCTRAFPPDNL